MNALHWVLLSAVVLGASTGEALAQAGTVTGRATEQDTGRPLSGVQVGIAGTGLGTVTNQQGRYLLPNVPAGEHVIRFIGGIGHGRSERPVTVVAGETSVVDIELRVVAIDLDQLLVSVVTGRAERKRELGTNTATITSGELERAPLTRMADVLAGRAAGVLMQGVAGTVGTSQRIRIRGANSISLSNEPLIFVDGIQFANNKGGFGVGGQDYSRLNDINPEDIANVEILKGPAASALYGTAAANGVVLITTRRGLAGPARWRAYSEYGTSEDRTAYPANYMAAQRNDPNQDVFLPDGRLNSGANTFCPNESAARGVCRQDEAIALNPFRTAELRPYQTGRRQRHGLSVQGGGAALTYFLSADVEDETGVIRFNTQDRWTVRANVGTQVRGNLGFDVRSSYTRTNLVLNPNDNNIFSPLINTLLAAPMVPSAEMRDPASSNPGLRPGAGFGYFLSDIAENVVHQRVDRFLIGGASNWQPFPWLSINSNVGLDYFSRPDAQTIQPGRLPIAATWIPGWRQAQRSNSYVYTLSTAGVANHDFSATVRATTTLGAMFSREQFESTYCYGVGIVEGTRSCSATSSLFAIAEGYNEVRTVGAYLQQQIAFSDRLFLAASVRGDDNSAFGQDFGFIYYPAASASWVISEEPFFPYVRSLSNLRLRSAYGMSGQRPNFRDAVTLLDPVSATVGNQELSAVRLSRVGNPDLKPERTTEFEIGFDAGFLDDRVGLELNYFRKQSRDALIARPLPPSFGLTGDLVTTGVIWDNLGSVKNWGTELAFRTRMIQLPSTQLEVRLSATTLDNRIEDLGEHIQPIVFNRGNQQHKQGFPTGGFFGRTFAVENPGQQRLLTRDDVVATSDSVVFLGRQLPKNTQSLATDLSLFRNLLRVTALFERRAGHFQLNYSELFRCQTGYNRAGTHRGSGNCAGVADPEAPIAEQARFIANRLGVLDPTTGTRVATQAGYVEPADFIKWRELSVTLTPPERLLRGAALLRGATVTVAGRNLATWTDYTGLDPEINESGGSSNFTQGEFNTQPPLRYFLFRVNYTF